MLDPSEFLDFTDISGNFCSVRRDKIISVCLSDDAEDDDEVIVMELSTGSSLYLSDQYELVMATIRGEYTRIVEQPDLPLFLTKDKT